MPEYLIPMYKRVQATSFKNALKQTKEEEEPRLHVIDNQNMLMVMLSLFILGEKEKK